jgi:hypothetical protein
MLRLTDAYRALGTDLDLALSAYKQMRRRPDLYDEPDACWWERRLGHLYDQIALADYQRDCDGGGEYGRH